MAAVKDMLGSAQNAYVECALWSSTDEAGAPLDSQPYELAVETTEALYEDVWRFMAANERTLHEAGLSASQIGHDLWLTRNRHGAGFWDRNLGRVGIELTEAAEALGERYLYVGDDGEVYVD